MAKSKKSAKSSKTSKKTSKKTTSKKSRSSVLHKTSVRRLLTEGANRVFVKDVKPRIGDEAVGIALKNTEAFFRDLDASCYKKLQDWKKRTVTNDCVRECLSEKSREIIVDEVDSSNARKAIALESVRNALGAGLPLGTNDYRLAKTTKHALSDLAAYHIRRIGDIAARFTISSKRKTISTTDVVNATETIKLF